jgi:DNA-binding PadR family transcriptional regulator
MVGQRSRVLELAVLGLLHETPMHGYELRKRLNSMLGAFRAFGYGSLYPCLKLLLAQGLIAEEAPEGTAKPLAGRRSKIVYRLTADGKERLEQLLTESGPAAWDDDGFGVHFAFFGQTQADIRLRIRDGPDPRADGQLHARTAPARPGIGRAGGPLAERADRLRAPGGRGPGQARPARIDRRNWPG